ncbi:EH domain-binding protein 1 [Chelonia mydas]|uniref:EH domain-binding protein 1 n=1 Tax=Chelonia mydas TaxID=8469 RepID=M7BLQ2_CHEMY|nr:EH domain-binding protein 1 [Chelonia mydas]
MVQPVYNSHIENNMLTEIIIQRMAHSWQPGIKNPYRGVVVWPVPENIEITVTLFKSQFLFTLRPLYGALAAGPALDQMAKEKHLRHLPSIC